MKKIIISFKLALLLSAFIYASPSWSLELIQNTDARKHVSLNGEWHIIPDIYENGFYNHRYEEKENGYYKNAKIQHPSDLIEYDFSASPTIQVPGDWNSQSERMFFYEGTVWYHKDFSLNKKKSKHYILHFGAVNYEAVVYVNGKKVGRHEGGFTSFQFDVSSLLVQGDNFVVVKVDNRRERDQIPTVNTDWWNYGGITRPVKLLELNAEYVADYAFQLDQENENQISGWVEVASKIKTNYGSVEISVPELGILKTIQLNSNTRANFNFTAKPERWSPENPKLYQVVINYKGSQIEDKVGFRTVSVKDQNILLNGKALFLRGISIHEEAPTREGRAWSEDDARTTLTWAKELGCNFVRLAHYPHNETMLKMADELGLLVWSEIPVYWTVQFEKQSVFSKAEKQLSEMISRDKNRAAIILWSVANETPNHETRFTFLEKLVSRARELDSSRLITAALDTQTSKDGLKVIDDPFASIVDVIGINSYCGWYGGTPESCADLRWHSPYNKPVIMSEFGGGALYGKHGKAIERWTEEYQAAVYKHNITMIENMPFVKGTTPWILKDFRSPRRPLPEIQDYWNRKGLVSEKGERKLAWKELHEFYEKKKPGK